MNQTEERVVVILTSQPPSLHPLRAPIHAVAAALGWESARTMAFVEYLMLCKFIVLKVEAVAGAVEGQPAKLHSWWERGDAI